MKSCLRKSIKRARLLALGILINLGGLLLSSAMVCANGKPFILLINSDASVEKYSLAQAAFKKALAPAMLKEISLNEKPWKRPEDVKELLYAENPDLIYCIGAKAYLLAQQYAGDKHIVFSSMLNWRRFEPLPQKTYGIANERPAEMQITLFRHLFPAVRTIGILYSPTYTAQWFQETKDAAGKIGVDIIGQTVANKKQAVAALHNLLPKIDAFWLLSDPDVTPDRETVIQLLQQCDAQKIPVFSSHEEFAKFGAVLIVAVDSATVGWQAADIAAKSLAGKAVEGKVQIPGGSHIILNLPKVKEYRLPYNWDALDSVDQIEEQVFSQDAPLPEVANAYAKIDREVQWLKAETYVITASRVLEDIKKSAASITVITDEQIRQMGARHVMDVLRTIPGMSFEYDSTGQYEIDTRGIKKAAGQDILFMINSHSVNENFLGGFTWNYDTLLVENIQRIEFIRGPGSALYGANAFSGVINIITKNAEDIDGIQVSAIGGSYNTKQLNVLFGKTLKDIGIAFNLNHFDTDGFEGYIEKDTQTLLDEQFGTNASLAPGYTKGRDRRDDISLMVQYKGFKFDGRYSERERDESVGLMYALTNKSVDAPKDYYLNLSYEGTIREGLTLSGKVYRNYHLFDSYYQVFPPGTVAVNPNGERIILPEGIIGLPSNQNDRTGIEIMTTYRPSNSNTVVVGVTYEQMKQYDVKYKANFLYTPEPLVIIPLDSIQDITDRQNYNKDVSRTFKAIFFEDIWDIKDNLRLTVGARYDDYSDFGESFNPRAGLIWQFTKGYDLKLLYGRAFRAPIFYELYNKNNPAYLGNDDLNPEKVETYEVSFGTEFNTLLSGRITGFRNTIKDSIELLTINAQNIFDNTGMNYAQGIETELKLDFGKGTYIALNYTYQDTENLDTKEPLPTIPKHKGNIIGNIRLSRYVNLYMDFHFQKGFTRDKGDEREDHPGFSYVNSTVLVKDFLPGLEIRGSVYNLFDKQYTFPSDEGSLPVDFPMPGRSFLVELRYSF